MNVCIWWGFPTSDIGYLIKSDRRTTSDKFYITQLLPTEYLINITNNECMYMGWCKGTTHFHSSPSPSPIHFRSTPILRTQLRQWLHNSDSGNATPIAFTDLPSRRSPLCLPRYCTVPSHAHLAYFVVIPSRVFLRVFSLDFPLLG
jgi:hypothetical protein